MLEIFKKVKRGFNNLNTLEMKNFDDAEKYCDCVLDDLMDDYDTAEDALSADLYSYAVECVTLD